MDRNSEHQPDHTVILVQRISPKNGDGAANYSIEAKIDRLVYSLTTDRFRGHREAIEEATRIVKKLGVGNIMTMYPSRYIEDSDTTPLLNTLEILGRSSQRRTLVDRLFGQTSYDYEVETASGKYQHGEVKARSQSEARQKAEKRLREEVQRAQRPKMQS